MQITRLKFMNSLYFLIIMNFFLALMIVSCSNEEHTVLCPAGFYPEGFEQYHMDGNTTKYNSNSKQVEILFKQNISNPYQKSCANWSDNQDCSTLSVCRFQAEANGTGVLDNSHNFRISFTFWNNNGTLETIIYCGEITVFISNGIAESTDAPFIQKISDTTISGMFLQNLWEFKRDLMADSKEDSIYLAIGNSPLNRQVYSFIFHNKFGVVSFKKYDGNEIFIREF